MSTDITFSPEDLKKSDSKTLSAYVVLYKSLGINRELAIECMKELALRRTNGDEFDYELFIQEELDKIPKPKNVDYKQIFQSVESNLKSFAKLSQNLRAKIDRKSVV